MLCMQRQSKNGIYETCRYLLILTAKNTAASEIQSVGNYAKTNNQTYENLYED